jgi:hypothetical protein
VTHQYLRETASTRPTPTVEVQQDAVVPSEETWQRTQGSGALSASPWMSHGEAEQLADEMSQEASWYLERISVRPEPSLGDHVCIVEASIVDSTFAIAYATRQDWWLDHQGQLRHRQWENKKTGKIQK